MGGKQGRYAQTRFQSVVDAVEFATLAWVHWFNTERLHSPLGDIPPAEFEADYYRQLTGTGELVET